MSDPQAILKDSTEDIYSYAPRLERLTGAEVKFITPSDGETFDTYQAATIDSIAEPMAAAAAEGAAELIMGALTSAQAGNKYFIVNSALSGLTVAPLAVTCESSAGAVVFLSEPLEREIGLGARLFGYRVSLPLPATSTEQAGECLAHWKTTYLSGDTEEWVQQFRIVSARINPYTLTPDGLRQAFPEIAAMRYRSNSLQEVLDVGWQMLSSVLEGRGLYTHKIKSWEKINWAHAQACNLHVRLSQEDPDMGVYDRAEEQYRETVRILLENSKIFWYSDDETLRADDPAGALPGMRVVR